MTEHKAAPLTWDLGNTHGYNESQDRTKEGGEINWEKVLTKCAYRYSCGKRLGKASECRIRDLVVFWGGRSQGGAINRL